MKTSIRTKFTLVLLFFFVIILALSILSALQLSRLSKKTSAILRENHVSVVYAREMSKELTNINQEITRSFILKKFPDSAVIHESLSLFDKSLRSEKNNITEVGENELVSSIDLVYNEYRDSLQVFIKKTRSLDKIIFLQQKFTDLNRQLMLLSQMNVNAIELKTNNARISTKKALLQLTSLATLCFLIALSFTYSFASYINERFLQLRNGIKEVVSNNYGRQLHFDAKDEFYDFAMIFNEMVEKLNKNRQNLPIISKEGNEKEIILQNVEKLERILMQLKNIEEQTGKLLSKFKTPEE
jgi:two-component system, NtrC family, sensor histidine kinase KinB